MAVWDESEHPRDEEGKFTYKNGGEVSRNSNPLLLGGVEYNVLKENREDILYKDTTLKEKLSNYRNKLLDFLGDNLEREEILYSNISELENKILNNTVETIQATREKLANSVNKLRNSDFKSENDFKTFVNKAQKNYDAMGEFGKETNNMFKINIQKGENGFGEEAISSVLRYKKSLERETEEIVKIAENRINQGVKQEEEKKLNNQDDEMNGNQTISNKRPVEPPVTQIQSKNQENNRYKTKVDPSKIVADWIMPCEGRISSPYGWRIHPITKERTFHSGIDIKVPVGTPVRAIADGKIVKATGNVTGYGNAVYINHGNVKGKIVESEYGHLSKIIVYKNQNVKKGEIIGLSGGKPGTPGAGSSTGAHLHLTIREYSLDRKKKKHEDPIKYLDFN